ncbi:hypothetical protein NC653_026307 [Populus alba x Populus x berolinensis]|uniref:K Homology domain-containing protein n=2 Tax=Populus alba x Populus x berolinensis TaxID=444605 RepID=A0AAD6MDB0_9ROSI|nr:hypothetical protein NC653_026307 [Populus alba x Populus x berolinensis]
MESTESSYVSSPEQPQKRSPPPPASPPSDSEEKPTYTRFLVSNAAAGSVIGKGGATITDFQSQSGARIQLSRNYEFFPGTSDRIIMVSGGIDDVLKAVELIIAKLLSEIPAEDGDEAEPRMRVRLVVPNSACGSIIGKGGSIIKSFIEESHAGIKISPLDTKFFGLTDRLVTVTGTLEEQMHAIDLILSKLTDDPHYSQTMHAPFSYAGVFFSGFDGIQYACVLPYLATAAYNSMNHGPNGAAVKFQHNKVHPILFYNSLSFNRKPSDVLQDDITNSVTIGVADEHIGLVVGRGGRNIMEISQMEWSQPEVQGDLVTPRAGHAGVTIGENWYIVGGGDNKNGCPETLVLNMSKLAWSALTSVKERDPLASEGLSVCSALINGERHLVAFGGYNGKYNNEVFVMRLKPSDASRPKIFQSPAAAAAAASVTAAYALAKSEKLDFSSLNLSSNGVGNNPSELDLAFEIDALKEEKKELELSLTEVRAENSRLTEKVDEVNGTHAELSKELHSVQGQLAAERSRCFKLEAQIAELQKILESLQSIENEVQLLRRQKSALEQEIERSAAQRQGSGGVWRWIAG